MRQTPDKAQAYWATIRSDDDAEYDDELVIDGSTIEPSHLGD